MPTHSHSRGLAQAADLHACRNLLRSGSRTFLAASLLLPRHVRDPATALYAFCRIADDLVDNGGGAPAMAALRLRLAKVYEGRPSDTPFDRAFADVVARYTIPQALPEALFEGFAWDAAGRRYDDIEGLQAYAARVAGTVGVMMALIMGARGAAALSRACDLGVAMQLTNIARDVGEDARAGRLYLPLEWLAQAGVDSAGFLANPTFTPALGSVVQRLLDHADVLYQRACDGLAALPLNCRIGIGTAGLLYAEIGREVERRGCDSVTSRATVSARCKMARLGAVLTSAFLARGGAAAAPLAETRFLVEAITGAAVAPSSSCAMPARRPVLLPQPMARMIWLLDLFERMERRESDREIMAVGTLGHVP